MRIIADSHQPPIAMAGKSFSWRKLMPAQIALIERLAAADGAIAFEKLNTQELAAVVDRRAASTPIVVVTC